MSDEIELATITVRKVMTDDDLIVYTQAVDEDGDDLALIDALGMLEFAKHMLLERYLRDDEDESEED